jgi:SAM-dependent methyltransferase
MANDAVTGAPAGSDEERWRRFVELTTGQPPWPELVRAAALFDAPGDALDVGAGAGRDTIHLLSRGWRVTAVDSSPAAVAALRRIGSPRLDVVASTAQDFAPAAYDLVNAQYSLPFVPPSRFAATVSRLGGAVRPGGAICALFFGPRDEWNRSGTEITFTTAAVVRRVFNGWEIVEFEEVEEDGRTADGSPKHWHVLHVTARPGA